MPHPTSSPTEEKVRLDKWLWATRFFKTRTLATDAVSGGKVHLNGTRIKPSRAVAIGVTLQIRKGPQEFTVLVKGIATRRGPAKEAALLYEETAQSRHRRAALAATAKTTPPPRTSGRPSKKDRRSLARLRGE